MSRKIVAEVSKEALAELFDPASSMDLNVPLAEHLLRMLAYEHLNRGGDRTEPALEALVGPKECSHGRPREGRCHDCEGAAGDDEELNHKSAWATLRAFCAAYQAGQPFDRRRLFDALTVHGYNRRKRDPNHDQQMRCARVVKDHKGNDRVCGHPYERHFDGYEDDEEVGCKYCSCRAFMAPEKLCVDPG